MGINRKLLQLSIIIELYIYINWIACNWCGIASRDHNESGNTDGRNKSEHWKVPRLC